METEAVKATLKHMWIKNWTLEEQNKTCCASEKCDITLN